MLLSTVKNKNSHSTKSNDDENILYYLLYADICNILIAKIDFVINL